jgi:hypothetical protein
VRIAVAVLLMWTTSSLAQTGSEPALHHRVPGSGSDSASAPSTPGGKQKGTSTLPPSAQGEFMLDETGSVVQITIENGTLDGYVSKLVEGQTASLTYFFDRTTSQGDHLTFTTRQVHGIWYSFDGTIVRGDAASKQETGFYRLKGTWVMHNESDKSQSATPVSFKSTPRGSSEFPDLN